MRKFRNFVELQRRYFSILMKWNAYLLIINIFTFVIIFAFYNSVGDKMCEDEFYTGCEKTALFFNTIINIIFLLIICSSSNYRVGDILISTSQDTYGKKGKVIETKPSLMLDTNGITFYRDKISLYAVKNNKYK